MRLSDIITKLQTLQEQHGERLVTSLHIEHGIIDIEHEPLPVIAVPSFTTDWNTPIAGRDVIN